MRPDPHRVSTDGAARPPAGPSPLTPGRPRADVEADRPW